MEHPLLARYLAGECAEAEAAEVRAWIAASRGNLRLYREFEAIWRASPTESAWDAEAAFTAFTERLHERPYLSLAPSGSMGGREQRSRWHWAPATRAAAAVALLVGGAAVARVAFWSHGEAAPQRTAWRTAATPRGQRATLRLPDGTNVMLGAASRLRYADAFETGPRDVTLEGEAYFDVKHDAHRPFVVHAANLVATDLGTQFVVRAYPGETQADVVVRAGKVALRAASTVDSTAARILLPGQLGRLGAAGEALVEHADTVASFAWTHGQLVLVGAPLAEAAARIGRWYDVEVQLASPSLNALRLTASFEDEPVPEVLRLVAASLHLRLSQARRTYTLSPK